MRTTIKRLATVSNDSLHGDSRRSAAVFRGFVNKTPTEIRSIHSTLQVKRPKQNARGVWQLCLCNQCYVATKNIQAVFGIGGAEEGRVSANGKATKVIGRSATINRLATVSNDALHGESQGAVQQWSRDL